MAVVAIGWLVAALVLGLTLGPALKRAGDRLVEVPGGPK